MIPLAVGAEPAARGATVARTRCTLDAGRTDPIRPGVEKLVAIATGALVALCLALAAPLALGACAKREFTESDRVRLTGDAAMIVTHATAAHDARYATKRGVDEATRFAKDRRIPLVYLHDDGPDQLYFMDDCEPDYWVRSEGGEVRFELPVSQVYVAGGHLELCLSTTLHDVLYAWARQPRRNLVVTYLMDAIYSNGKSVEESDPYYKDFLRFMSVVTYGRPGGEHWPKLSLLETMGVIQNEQHELEYLTKVLPRWDRTLPSGYRIELQLNDSVVKVLRPAPGWNPPTLRFRFVDSALNLAH